MLPRYSVARAFLPVIAGLALAAGCSKKEADKEEDLPKKRFVSGRDQGGAAAVREPLKAVSLDGEISGRVVLQGEKPVIAIEARMATHTDHAGCLAGSEVEKINQTWILGDNNGVANVVVFLKAPAGKYFPIDKNQLKKDDKDRMPVVLDQPHCAFIPHVAAAFPSYWDGKALQPTGEQFLVKNSAPFNHNTSWKGDTLKTGTGNRNLKSTEELVINLVPESNPIQFNCDIHPWMTARVWAFDHPYFDVTKGDGKFVIKNVPTGVELALVAWHEVPQFFHNAKQKFNPGENKIPDLKISAK